MRHTASGDGTRTIPDHVPANLVYDFDYIYDPRLLEDPHERMRSLQTEAPPIFFSPYYGGHWVITRRSTLADVTSNSELFSSYHKLIPPTPQMNELLPGSIDPPRHAQYRIPLNKAFSPKAVARFEGDIRRMSADLIDAVVEKGRCEFLAEVAEPIPPTIFFLMSGMPTDRLREFRKLAENFTAAPDPLVRQQTMNRIREVLGEIVRARTAEPRDDLISELVKNDFGGRKLSHDEIVSYASMLFFGGLETVVNTFCFSARHLAKDQALQAELRADPSRIPVVAEELLRIYAIAMTIRRVTRDVEYERIQFRKDDMMMLLIPSINYDSAAFEDAGDFRPGRAEGHVTFNLGPHRCIGSNLARLEIKVFFEEWLRRIPTFHLDPDDPPRFLGGLNIAFRSLPLLWQGH